MLFRSRAILAVGVHHDHCVAGEMLMHVSRGQRNRPLMAHVAAQAQDLDLRAGWQLKLNCQWNRGAIINQQHSQRDVRAGERALKVLQKAGRRRRVIVHGGDHHQTAWCALARCYHRPSHNGGGQQHFNAQRIDKDGNGARGGIRTRTGGALDAVPLLVGLREPSDYQF